MTAYIVAGTQAPPGKQNHVIVMKMSQLDKTASNDDESKWIQVQKMILAKEFAIKAIT